MTVCLDVAYHSSVKHRLTLRESLKYSKPSLTPQVENTSHCILAGDRIINVVCIINKQIIFIYFLCIYLFFRRNIFLMVVNFIGTLKSFNSGTAKTRSPGLNTVNKNVILQFPLYSTQLLRQCLVLRNPILALSLIHPSYIDNFKDKQQREQLQQKPNLLIIWSTFL